MARTGTANDSRILKRQVRRHLFDGLERISRSWGIENIDQVGLRVKEETYLALGRAAKIRELIYTAWISVRIDNPSNHQ